MNAHQRKKCAAAKHYRMPLGCRVRVYSRDRKRFVDGVLTKHDRSGRCIVDFPEHNEFTHPETTPFAWVSYASVRPLDVNRERPWWRVTRERHLRSARS